MAGLGSAGERPPWQTLGWGRCQRRRSADGSGADLLIGLERSHVREIVLSDPPSFAFTQHEMIRRGPQIGPRREGQTLADWLTQLGDGRRHSELLGSSSLDDIPDPMGGTSKEYRTMFTELATSTRTLRSLIWP
jgi:hypothetical protein